jgi:altronate dehydratase
MRNALVIDPADNVATLLCEAPPQTDICWDEGARLVTREHIPEGHKVALCDIAKGEIVRKYGHPIGAADRDIAAGEHVHTHNLARDED